MRYSVVLEPDEEEPHRYNVRVPALPGCLTYGESIEDAITNATEAIAVYLESLAEDGLPPPGERTAVVTTTIAMPVPGSTQARYLLGDPEDRGQSPALPGKG